jgi:molecular chaperone DnaK
MSADADVIGNDPGTTQSLVGVVDAGFPILLADARGRRMTRSVVDDAKDGRWCRGTGLRCYSERRRPS